MSDEKPQRPRPLIRVCIEVDEDRDERVAELHVTLTTRPERWPFERQPDAVLGHDTADEDSVE
jgi:hypothetical protein